MSDGLEPTGTPTAGALLRQAREAAGLHIAALAATLKVPVQRLEALEQGRYDALPDAAFTRALALSVCRALKIDAGPVLAALPAAPAPQLSLRARSLDAPMPQEAGSPAWGGGPMVPRRGSLWLALALVALAAVLWLVLPPADEPAPPAAVAPAPAADATAGTIPDAAPRPPAAPEPAAPTAGPRAPEDKPPVAVETGSAPGGETSVVATTAAASANAASAPLRLRARAASWVQIIGASGQVWLQRTLQPGETFVLDRDLPLAVTVGRADATEAWVRGQPMDLAPMARNNVARFEVR